MEVNSKVINELDNKYRQRLFFLARRMIGNAETAEEVVQDAFHIINNKHSDFRGDSDIYTWMYRITCNLCLKAKSSLSKERIDFADSEMKYFNSESDFTGQKDLSEIKNNPELNYIYKELIYSVKQECHFVLLGLLTKEQRIVYLMRTHEKMKFKEIGDILEIGENAAKSRMNRALSIIENDLKTRCSLCNSTNNCNCDECAAYIIYKNPAILKKMREK
jgi:RNA polymerase sigma-70 factor, ECF subfamily